MERVLRMSRGWFQAVFVTLMAGMGGAGCGLFDTRDPEAPTASNCLFLPPTRPGIAVINLQNAVAQKCVDNYGTCFSGRVAGQPPFVYVPSAEAMDQYGAVLTDWSVVDEQAYFRNLVARSVGNGFANLFLTPRDSIITADSVLFIYDYTLTFEHTEPAFPMTARGNMRITLVPDAGNAWMIVRWVDLKTTDDITWSLFRGKFGN